MNIERERSMINAKFNNRQPLFIFFVLPPIVQRDFSLSTKVERASINDQISHRSKRKIQY